MHLNGVNIDIPDEFFATLPDNIEAVHDGDELTFSIIDITGRSADDFYMYRDLLEDAVSDLIIGAGLRTFSINSFGMFTVGNGITDAWVLPFYQVFDSAPIEYRPTEATFADMLKLLPRNVYVVSAFLVITPLIMLNLRMKRWRKATFGIKHS